PLLDAGPFEDPLELCSKIDVTPAGRAQRRVAVIAAHDELGALGAQYRGLEQRDLQLRKHRDQSACFARMMLCLWRPDADAVVRPVDIDPAERQDLTRAPQP